MVSQYNQQKYFPIKMNWKHQQLLQGMSRKLDSIATELITYVTRKLS